MYLTLPIKYCYEAGVNTPFENFLFNHPKIQRLVIIYHFWYLGETQQVGKGYKKDRFVTNKTLKQRICRAQNVAGRYSFDKVKNKRVAPSMILSVTRRIQIWNLILEGISSFLRQIIWFFLLFVFCTHNNEY